MISPRGLRRLLATSLGAVALISSEALLVACRKDAPTSRDESAAAPDGAADAEGTPSPVGSEGQGDSGGEQGRDREARVSDRRADAGSAGGACEGATISLLGAALNPRCEISEREWNDLVRAARAANDAGNAANGALRQEARREGDHVVLSIVNRGTRPLVLPLRYHPGHPELAFSVLAESEGRGVFELATPTNDAPPEGEAGTGTPTVLPTMRARGPERPNVLAELDAGLGFRRVHSARIRLAAGGVARARLVIDPKIVKRLDRSCTDGVARARPRNADASADAGGAECLPARLPKGRTVLYVGQLVTGIDSGEPARVEWDAP